MTSTLHPDHTDVITRAADRLRAAANSVRATRPVRDLLGDTDIPLAYAVQAELTRRRLADGARIVGRKIGLTSSAVQQQLGVHQPDFGVLFDDMLIGDGATIDSARLIQPKAEAEIAFVLGSDLGPGLLGLGAGGQDDLGDDAPVSAAERHTAADAVAYAVAALEIVDSRIENWQISITDTVADNASSGLFVLGRTHVPLAHLVPADVTMTMRLNGQPVSSGDGTACLGDPLVALAWLARTLARLGTPLHAGDIVLSGALGPMVPAEPGAEVVAELSTLGRVSATFSQ